MKNFLFLILSTLTLNAWSQQSLETRIYAKASSVQRLIQERTYRLSYSSQLAVFEQLRSLEATLLNDSGGGPLPAPVPNPYPGRISVRGSIESRSFSFEVSDSLQVYQNCTAFVRDQRIQQVDDLLVSVNFQPERSARNSAGWWTGAGQICLKVAEMASAQGVRMSHYGFVFAGAVENLDFLFIGNSLVEIDQQCSQFVQRNRIGQVDDIQVTRDFAQVRILHNSSSYWNGAYEICQRIIQAAR